MNQAVRRIQEILTSEYNTSKFTDFVREIFPGFQIVAPDRFREERSNFSSHIEGSAYIGNYIDPEDKKIIILSVQLKKETYVENSRSTQRSYAKKLIEAGNADAAIIAFYTEGDSKWRISFVRLDYELKFENGKLNTNESITPAKRYSYLVGKDEPCHTAISRFYRFIVDENSEIKPSIDDLEEAFSVEKVTDEFFKLYCEKFHQLREALEYNTDFVAEAEQHNFTSAQFAKKLMGQIVFLYFLQKKGWLGVKAWPRSINEKEYNKAYYAKGQKSRELIPLLYKKDSDDRYVLTSAIKNLSNEDETVLAACVKGDPWGTGPKNFMRKLFEVATNKGANFFDEYLEPLFYDALNVNRGEQGYDPALHCRIPFLSGGLFEPIDGYDWEHNDFSIPNNIFSNKEEKGERDADGILDIFDRYNFTMSEDEPMEREVAIDPEMLGKVFENLLEVKDRKAAGAFYTPREIVHYMCQETLITYLVKETGLKERDIRDFILFGDFLKDEDTRKEQRQGSNDMLISDEIYKVDKEGKVVVNRLKDIDKALANIRVADPAVGSGAFPLGMLNEIVRARQNISAYLAITMNAYETKMMYNNDRSPYSLKVQTIKNCIFAADIEPSAVDIAQLRLWLSLVIDDEINPDAESALDGHRNPIPLPNLECNIVCGNSLIDEFEGIPLINYSELIGTAGENQQINAFTGVYAAILPALIAKQNQLFRCDDTAKKQELKESIEALKDELIKIQMQTANDKWERYQVARRQASRPFVLWQIDFARVFNEKGGFDIIIGNPPYGIVYDEEIKPIYEKKYSTFKRNNDMYIAFYENALYLGNESAIISLITPNTYLIGDYFKTIRKVLKEKTKILGIVDYKNNPVFADPTVYVAIGTFIKHKPEFPYVFNMKIAKDSIFDFNNFEISVESISEKEIRPIDKLFLLIDSKKDFNLRDYYEVKDIGFNYWSKGKGKTRGNSIGSRVLYNGAKEASDDIPFLKGRDIEKYYRANPSNYLRHNYIEYLEENDTFRFSPEIMRNPEKIIYRQTANRIIATIDEEGMYNDKTVHCIIPKKDVKIPKLYLLGLLNSKLFEYLYREISQESDGRAFSQVKTVYVKQLPIKVGQPEDVHQIIDLVEKAIEKRKTNEDILEIEKEIDIVVNRIYGLDDDVEIKRIP